MTYEIRFTNDDKSNLTVFDNTSNTDTSLVFPGRNTSGYGQIIAENFLHLLENFASNSAPVSPVEGQLWYDSGEDTLKISDGISWKAASGIYKSPVEPGLDSSREGELWIDTTNQQLRIFNGSRWILVGPSQTSIGGLKYGPTVETIDDTASVKRSIIVFYIADIAVSIVSKDSFVPKIAIPGFADIKAGVNLNKPQNADEAAQFVGGNLPKLIGTAESAEGLTVTVGTTTSTVPASRFLRSDIANITDAAFNVRSNNGITIGREQNFSLSTGIDGVGRIYNSFPNSSLNIQINRNGVAETVIRVQDNRVGINTDNPQRELDVVGSAAISSSLLVSGTTISNNINSGSFRTLGGAAIAKNLRAGENVVLNQLEPSVTENPGLTVDQRKRFYSTETRDIKPLEKDFFDLGKSNQRWNTVYANTIDASTIRGTLIGDFNGTAKRATSLESSIRMRLTGDVASPEVSFIGEKLDTFIEFNTSLTSNIIVNKTEPPDGRSRQGDYVLIYRPGDSSSSFTGLLKITRDNFVSDLGLPLGTILPFAGIVLPEGFLLCDGSEIQKSQYPALYSTIGDFYNGSAPLLGFDTFRLPDLRGRFALGRDVMDNALTVPLPTGGFVDAGGGEANRVPDSSAKSLAGSGGGSSQTLNLSNLPEHSHSLTTPSGVQFFATRNDPSAAPPAIPGPAGTASGQAQLLNDTGGIKKPNLGFALGQPFDVMNPYLTINYIIRAGFPAF
jgi:microcystin-dependent protein